MANTATASPCPIPWTRLPTQRRSPPYPPAITFKAEPHLGPPWTTFLPLHAAFGEKMEGVEPKGLNHLRRTILAPARAEPE